MFDVIRRHKELTTKSSDGATDREKSFVDAVLALDVDDDTMISDLLTFFIGGFHTSASRELAAVSVVTIIHPCYGELPNFHSNVECEILVLILVCI